MKVFWGDSAWEVVKFRNLQENRAEVVQIWWLITKLGEVIVEWCHYWREFWSTNDFILWNWGACVDTVFGHVSLDTHLELMKCRSAGGEMVTSLHGSCRWRLVPMGKQPNMAKSRGGDAFVPMTSADGCRWLWKAVCRCLRRKAHGLPIDAVAVYRSIAEDSLMFSLVIRIRFVYGFRLISNSSSSRVWL